MTDVLETTDQVEIASLRRQLNQAEFRLANVSEYRDVLSSEVARIRERFAKDVELIGQAFKGAAVDDSWEESYEAVLESINSRLEYELPTLIKDYSVEVNIRVIMTVQARDEDDARDVARSAVKDIESRIDNGSWGGEDVSVSAYPESSDEYSVEEA